MPDVTNPIALRLCGFRCLGQTSKNMPLWRRDFWHDPPENQNFPVIKYSSPEVGQRRCSGRFAPSDLLIELFFEMSLEIFICASCLRPSCALCESSANQVRSGYTLRQPASEHYGRGSQNRLTHGQADQVRLLFLDVDLFLEDRMAVGIVDVDEPAARRQGDVERPGAVRQGCLPRHVLLGVDE
jgi:hypothetical protein